MIYGSISALCIGPFHFPSFNFYHNQIIPALTPVSSASFLLPSPASILISFQNLSLFSISLINFVIFIISKSFIFMQSIHPELLFPIIIFITSILLAPCFHNQANICVITYVPFSGSKIWLSHFKSYLKVQLLLWAIYFCFLCGYLVSPKQALSSLEIKTTWFTLSKLSYNVQYRS